MGTGNCSQAPNLAAQTVLPTNDVPIGTSLILFNQLLGGAVFISVGQNILGTQLFESLKSVTGLDAILVQNEGATAVTQLPESIKPLMISAYNEVLRAVYRIGLIVGCLTVFGTLLMEWRSVKNNPLEENKDEVVPEVVGEGEEQKNYE